MGPLPSPLAELERNYLVLRARVESGEVPPSEAVARMASDAVYDANGARWRVDPAASPAHRALFLVAAPGASEQPGDPSAFPPGPPRPPSPQGTPSSASPRLPSRPDPGSGPVTAPRPLALRTTVLAAAALCAGVALLFLALRGCAPTPSAPGAPPSTPAGLEPLPPG